MRRAIPVFLSVAVGLFALRAPARALASDEHAPPPGITASAWVRISNDFAAVVERPAPNLYARDRQLPSAQGYFAVWRNGHWLRLDSLLLQSPMRRGLPRASAQIWISQNLAFAIERQTSSPRGEPRTAAAEGYFVIRRGGHWLRLLPIAQNALFRGPLRKDPTSEWIPITTTLRFVVEQRMPERYASGQLPSVLGYFIGKRGNRWLRLGSIA